MEVEFEVEKEKLTAEDEVSVILLLEKNPNFPGVLKSYEIELLGKKMWEWVSLSCEGYKIKTTGCTPESNILTLIKPLLDNSKYTIVLYSDTPLMKRKTISDIISYVKEKDFFALRLARGFVFNTQYIKSAETFQGITGPIFDRESFFVVSDNKTFSEAFQKIKQRILEFHLNNGVRIPDLNSVTIDADVIIEHGVMIEPNNSIKGASFIGKGCRLEFGNQIISSIVSSNCIIKNSYIFESRISENTVVGPFESVVGKSC